MNGRNRVLPKHRRVPLASFRIGYEEARLGLPFRERRCGAVAYESGRIVAAELRLVKFRLRPWPRRAVPPIGVMAMVASLGRGGSE